MISAEFMMGGCQQKLQKLLFQLQAETFVRFHAVFISLVIVNGEIADILSFFAETADDGNCSLDEIELDKIHIGDIHFSVGVDHPLNVLNSGLIIDCFIRKF
jgi:hypothetical protein